VAARLDTDQSGAEFWVRDYAPGPAGLENGQATIDEAYLEYRAGESPWSLRLGRFQAAFGLADIMKKSLDQNDSTSFDITWVDGAWWQWRGSGWTTHAIVRHNDRQGPTGALRRPLDFADSGSRAGLFLAAESRTRVGPVLQRMVTLTWLPSALRPNGLADPAVEDYLAATAKATAEWPLGAGGTKFRLGGEIGYAANTPRREAMDSGTGDSDALSWQASLNLMDIRPGHDFGIAYGRVADGWLSQATSGRTTPRSRHGGSGTPARTGNSTPAFAAARKSTCPVPPPAPVVMMTCTCVRPGSSEAPSSPAGYTGARRTALPFGDLFGE